jgi:hypothetical protein
MKGEMHTKFLTERIANKGPFRRFMLWWEDNIKIDLNELSVVVHYALYKHIIVCKTNKVYTQSNGDTFRLINSHLQANTEHCKVHKVRTKRDPISFYSIPRIYGTRKFITVLKVPTTCPYPEPAPSSPHNPLPLPEDPS